MRKKMKNLICEHLWNLTFVAICGEKSCPQMHTNEKHKLTQRISPMNNNH
jgi:hypothetical protein